jgi:hypothetical protein
MFEAAANEFPFVESLPKREKSRVLKTLDLLVEFSDLQKKHGTLLPAPLAWGVLGVSRQRLYELLAEGRLKGIQHHGQWYIPEAEFVEFCKLERKSGRPFKRPTFRECLTRGKELTKEFSK